MALHTWCYYGLLWLKLPAAEPPVGSAKVSGPARRRYALVKKTG